MVAKMKKALNRSCPDIEKIIDSNVIFTIKEEKEINTNIVKLSYKKVTEKVRNLLEVNSNDKIINHSPDSVSGMKLVNRYKSSDRSKIRFNSASKEHYIFHSNYLTGKSRFDDDSFSTKKSNNSRLSVPKSEMYKIPPSSDRKIEMRKAPLIALKENKELNSKIKGSGNSVQKNKLREINKTITSKKKETSIYSLLIDRCE